jgi:solute carrier family 25 citrate transporter 1
MAFVDKKETGLKTVVKGFLTGGTQASITYPTEFVKTQLQLQSKTNPEFNGIVDCMKKTVEKHGVAGLYRGAGVRIIGAGFQQMFRWGGYTNISYYMRDDNGKISPLMNGIAGMGGGICEAVFAVTPVETVKTRVTDDQRRGTGNYKGSGDAIIKIMKSEGPMGLYRGALPTILKQGTNQAVRMPLQQLFFGVLTGGDQSLNKSSTYNGAAGLLAGVGSVVLTQPQDCVKSRMQGEEAKKLYSGTVDCFMKMLKNEGPASFFAGSIPRMVQVGMTTGLSFAIYPLITVALNKVM